MYYRQAMTPKELFDMLSKSPELFYVLEAQLHNRPYRVAVYKYEDDYFVLKDPRIFDQVRRMNQSCGNQEDVLSYIETALEDNLYFKVKEDFIRLDLNIINQMADVSDAIVQYYEFIDL